MALYSRFALSGPLIAVLSLLPLAAQAQGASDVATGELDVVIEESFEPGSGPTVRYFLRDHGGRDMRELFFDLTPGPGLSTGAQVSVQGQARGQGLAVEAIEVLEAPAAAEAGAVPSSTICPAGSEVRNLVAILIDFDTDGDGVADRAAYPHDANSVEDTVFGAGDSMTSLYRGSSNDALCFEGVVEGPITIDVSDPAIHPDQSCNYYQWAYAAEAQVSMSGYSHRVFVLPHYSDIGACSWAGVANVGCGSYCRAWIAYSGPIVYIHEVGHNLSLAHASHDPENDGIGNSSGEIYGDQSDPMGYANQRYYGFNAGHHDQKGWATNNVTATGSASFELFPLHLTPGEAQAADPQGQGLQMVRIPRAEGGYYYLSYRQAAGHDSGLYSSYTNGVSVHRYIGGGYSNTYLIKRLAGGGDCAGTPGACFSDETTGVNVRQVSQNGASAVVEVSYGCVPGDPVVSVTPNETVVDGSGTSLPFTAWVTNTDTPASACPGNVIFDIYVNGNYQTELTLAAGASGDADFNVAMPAGDGSTTVTVIADDLDQRVGQGQATIIVDSTDPDAPGGLAGEVKRKTRVQLSWDAAGDSGGSGVESYLVYRDGAQIAEAGCCGYTDNGGSTGTTYVYGVSAVDRAGNVSAPAEVTVTLGGKTTGGGGGGNGGGGGRGRNK
jgi:hypothetical protein